ncbi:microtubule-associated tumor suppressor candidate 2 [Oncorhynchus kisutch]|uniref:microtubule-associated tumor suppressor candidate 2 n=1 Tax=Oncorhynchus kisutch TaxID=8019 RepID=UPI0012DF4438|nr:microtubule-associated tumor suppressor candidate 2-like [Oncorhynchus kisutch]
MSGQQGEPAIGHSHVGEVRNDNQNSHVGEVESNNQNQQAGGGGVGAVIPDGDANANQMIQMGEGGSDGGGESTGGDVDTLPPLMSQTTVVSQTVTEEQKNKIVIWGTDSQCDDPELAEFEMLECQELEAYLVEEEEEEEEEVVCVGVGVKGGARQILLDQPVSVVDLVSDSREGGGRRTIQRGSGGQDAATMDSGGTRGMAEYVTRAEFSSEKHVLVSRLSTMFSPDGSLVSALDAAGQTQATTTDSWHVPSGPSGPDGTILEDLTLASQSCTTISDQSKASQPSKQPQAPSKSTIQRADLDLNQNTTVRSEEVVVPEAQVSNNVLVGRCKCQQNMEEDQGNEKHNQNLEQRYQDVRGSEGKAVEEHQDARGSGRKAAEEHQDARGSGRKAAEEHQDARGSGGKAAEEHQDARGSGGKAVEEHQDARGSGGKAAEEHQDARGSGRKAAEEHQDARGSGGKAAEEHQDARGSGGKAAEEDQDARGSGRKAAEEHQDARGSGGKAAEDHKVIPPDMNPNSPAKLGTNAIQSVETRSLKKLGSFDKTSQEQGSLGQSMKKTTSFEQSIKKTTVFENTTKKSASFDRSLKKEPFLDRTLMKEASFDRTLRKQGSFERSSSPSSLDGRKPWGSPSRSPSRPATPPWSPRRQAPSSPAKTSSRPPSSTSPAKASNQASSQDRSDSPQRVTTSGLKAPSKVCVISSIPKPISPQPPADPRRASPHTPKPISPQPPADPRRASPHKPKPARPKIITYVRKNPQVKSQGTEVDPNEALTLPLRLSSPHPSPPTAHRKPHKTGPHSKASQVLCSSNILFDKYRQEMQKAGYFPPGTGMTSLGIKPPSHPPPHNLSMNSESFHGELPDRYMHELAPAPSQLAPQEGTGLYRSPRPRGPQLGLGAVTRQPAAAKNRTMFQGQTGQRSGVVTLSHPGQQQAPPGNNQGNHDSTADQRTPGPETTVARTLLPKPGQSRLRPPGFSALPPARLVAFGFVRSSSVSSVSINQMTVSNHSDPCRPSQRPSSGSDDIPLHLSPVPPSQSSPQPPNAPALHRRSVLPPARISPTGKLYPPPSPPPILCV